MISYADLQMKEGVPEEKPFFTDRIKIEHGWIIINNPSEKGEDDHLVGIFFILQMYIVHS